MEPTPSRPRFPTRSEYGREPAEDVSRRAWASVRERLETAESYWLATTRPDGRPHVVPIGGVWMGERLYFTMSPEAVTFRNLDRDPRAAVHLESAAAAVIVEGSAERPPPDAVPVGAAAAYGVKYEGTWDPADEEMPYLVLIPRVAMTWSSGDIRGSAVRWTFPAAEGVTEGR